MKLFRRVAIAISTLAIASTGAWMLKHKRSPWIHRYSSAEDRGAREFSFNEDFRLLDQFSDAHALTDYSDKASLFLVSVRRGCLPGGNELKLPAGRNQAAEHPVLFITDAPGERAADYIKETTPTLFDFMQIVASSFGLEKPGDFVELNPANGAIVRRGHLGGLSRSEACRTGRTQLPKPVYAKDVHQIFTRACVNCHIHFSGMDYFKSLSDVKNWSAMILRTLRLMRMPPGGADAHLAPVDGVTQPEDLRALVHWLQNGAPYTAEDELALARFRSIATAKPFRNNQIAGRSPDLQLQMKTPDRIPATGASYYAQSELFGPTVRDLYVEAGMFENNLEVFHHLNLHFLSLPLSHLKPKRRIDGLSEGMADLHAEGSLRYVKSRVDGVAVKGLCRQENIAFSISRRNGPELLPKGTAIFIPKGSYLELETHYNPSGREQTNQTKVGLFEYSGAAPPRLVYRLNCRPDNMEIPSNSKRYVAETSIPVEKDITLLNFNPHMHYRGRSSKLFVEEPGQPSRLLGSVAFYQLKFERMLTFKNPIFIKAGSTLRIVTTYDNSAQNVANPDPSLTVKYGGSTYRNEMHEMRLFYVEGRYSKADDSQPDDSN